MCVFSLSDISKVMDGPFKELKKNCENWINPEPVPNPRPGQVPNYGLTLQVFYQLYDSSRHSAFFYCCYATVINSNIFCSLPFFSV